MSFVCKWRIWLHLSGMAVFFPHNCVSLARLYSSVMVMFVGYDCVWCYSICGVRLCLVLQYLLGMNVYVQCDYLSGMIVWYEVICPVWLCLFSVYVRYDSICQIWFCLSRLFVGYDCVCPVWLCLSGMIVFVRYDCVCPVWLCLSGMIVFVRYDCICPVWLHLPDMNLYACHEYLSVRVVFVWYDYLSSVILFLLYEGICPVWLCLFSVYVRYDSICPIWFCLSQLFVGYDCFCPVWLCLAGMICLSGMTAFVRVYVREIWGIARKCTPDVTMAIFFDVKRKLYFPDAGQKQ
jgi:hypothetical protein